MEVQSESPDNHISKRAKLADTKPDPALPSEVKSLFADVMKTPDPIQSSVDLLTARPQDPIVWNLRLLIVENLSIDFEKELDLVSELVEDDSKNYLKWHYRRCIAEKIGIAAAHKEREFAAKILSEDLTNYLAWSHREWVLGALGGRLTDELDYCRKIIENNPFNAFAWNQRWTLIAKYCPEGDINTLKMMEVNRAFFAIECFPENESTWAYLRRLFKNGMTLMLPHAPPHAHGVERVLSKMVNDAKPLSGSADLDVLNLNVIGCFHALKLLLELMNHGYNPTRDVKDAVKILYPKSGRSGLGYTDKMRASVESLDLPE